MYYEMVKSIIAFENDQIAACVEGLQNVDTILRQALRLNYSIVKTKVSKNVWMAYVQGFQAWAAGEITDGEYVEYDGLSGSHLPLFNFVDAFLGLPQYLTEDITRRSIPTAQRDMTISIRKHGFREKAKARGNCEIELEMEKIVKQLRVCSPIHVHRPINSNILIPLGFSRVASPTCCIIPQCSGPREEDDDGGKICT
jgi:hypothetical protein